MDKEARIGSLAAWVEGARHLSSLCDVCCIGGATVYWEIIPHLANSSMPLFFEMRQVDTSMHILWHDYSMNA